MSAHSHWSQKLRPPASVGDLKGDGKPDIVPKDAIGKSRTALLGDGQGAFSGSLLSGDADRTYSTALADLNGDGSRDLVVSNDRPDEERVYFNDGQGLFRKAGTFAKPEWPTRYVTLADLNGDGVPDITASNRNGARSTSSIPSFVCYNDGSGQFPDCQPLPTKSSTIIVAADFDGGKNRLGDGIDLAMTPLSAIPSMPCLMVVTRSSKPS